jgi:hypothetical protein
MRPMKSGETLGKIGESEVKPVENAGKPRARARACPDLDLFLTKRPQALKIKHLDLVVREAHNLQPFEVL